MNERVFVTGVGAVSPVGLDTTQMWTNLVAGQSGVDFISSFETDGFETTFAAEIPEFDPTQYVDKKQARRMDRFVQLGVVAGLESLEASGLDIERMNPDRVGVLVGAGIGGLETIEATTTSYAEKGHKRISPFYIPSSIINMVSGNLSIMIGARGPNLSIVTACTTGTHCIGIAARQIQYGDCDVMIAGGTEAAITPTSMAGFAAARALSRRNDSPTQASRPWDVGRDGFVLGEGAGVVVLEEMQSAKRRGAAILAELSGFGMSGDAHHITQPSEGGEGASRCMENALQDGRIETTDVGYVNAHGTSTPQGDVGETLAVKRTFGTPAHEFMISSNKSMIGHLLGAAGGVEAVATVMSLHEQVLPPTINLDEPDPECDLDYVPGSARNTNVKVALSNSFGFGGTNGTLVFSRFDD